ncbi:hypothetical protein BRAS3809_3710003 [Bradyrhizobium sp. STM 3809]|nr:hypothetical protein BRAS3809_3710003 [Bradyrhizobium sp. STM 3809]
MNHSGMPGCAASVMSSLPLQYQRFRNDAEIVGRLAIASIGMLAMFVLNVNESLPRATPRRVGKGAWHDGRFDPEWHAPCPPLNRAFHGETVGTVLAPLSRRCAPLPTLRFTRRSQRHPRAR